MKKKRFVTLSVFVILTFILSGNVLAKEKFGIAFLGDLTGPLGFWNAPRLVGIQDAIEYLNKTYGYYRFEETHLIRFGIKQPDLQQK